MSERLRKAFDVRVAAAQKQLLDSPSDSLYGNGDEALYRSYEGSFTKLLEHDSKGVLTAEGRAQYEILVNALETGNLEELGRVRLQVPPQLDGTRRRVLINPQSAFSFEESGADVGQVGMPAPPSMSSRRAACEMLETYGSALLRDLRFDEYDGNAMAAMIARVMESFGEDYLGPKENGNVTPQSLYRGTTAGDQAGGFISQFLLLPFFPLFPSGCAPFVGELIGVGDLDLDAMRREQEYFDPARREFSNTEATFSAVQNGEIPEGFMPEDFERDGNGDYREIFLQTGRQLGGFVHVDSPYEAYYNALNILIFRGAASSTAFPYSGEFQGPRILNQSSGHTMGVPDAYALMARASIAAFKASWAQKWLAFRRLRPEVMAARVHFTLTGSTDVTDADYRATWDTQSAKENPFLLHPDLVNLGWEILAAVRRREQNNRTFLLTQMYPEGSPTHPAYPSGHATVAGACTTVLKAMFDDQSTLPLLPSGEQPRGYVQVNAKGNGLIDYEGGDNLTIGGELDKLASNIAHGRMFGGVHYRSDGDEGLLLGEEVAIRLLMDHARTYPEAGFRGFEFTRRNGTRIRVTTDDVIDL